MRFRSVAGYEARPATGQTQTVAPDAATAEPGQRAGEAEIQELQDFTIVTDDGSLLYLLQPGGRELF